MSNLALPSHRPLRHKIVVDNYDFEFLKIVKVIIINHDFNFQDSLREI